MTNLYKYLSSIAHNRTKLRFIAGTLLVLFILDLYVIWSHRSKALLDVDWPALATYIFFPVSLLLTFSIFLDYRVGKSSVSKVSITKDKLLQKYERDASRVMQLNGIKLSSTTFHTYTQPRHIEDLSIQLEDGWFQIPWYVEQYCNDLITRFSPATTFNGLTMRFDGFAKGDPLCFRFRYATYYDYLITNGSHDRKLFNELTVRDILEPGPGLSPIWASQCANHLGLSSLVFTSDNHLLLPKRSKNVSIFSGMLSPSVSGTANYDTFASDSSELSFATWFETELREELSKDLTLCDFASIRVLGLSRELLRLGKPELFFVARLKLSKEAFEGLLSSQNNVPVSTRVAILATAAKSPATIARNESAKFVWLKCDPNMSLTDILSSCKIEQVKNETELRITIGGEIYLMSESLAANLSFLSVIDKKAWASTSTLNSMPSPVCPACAN